MKDLKTFPQWLKRPLATKAIDEMNLLLGRRNLNTVCKSARCPNVGECFQNKEATFMLLGNICTRGCLFCSVEKGIPLTPDPSEPYRVAEAVKELSLEYVVLTSVTRDDLHDGGAGQFASTISAIRYLNPKIIIEVLTPDFNNDRNALNVILESGPDVFSHNIETVPRLYNKIRPNADFKNSLSILNFVKLNSSILTKSSFMLGLGEREDEVIGLLKNLKNVSCDMIAIGQYLRPDKNCVPVFEFIEPERFEYYKKRAYQIGISNVNVGPFVRSSYRAKQMYKALHKT